MPNSALPPTLQGKRHTDWPWPFSRITRGATAFDWGKPRILVGRADSTQDGSPKPINPPGTFQISYFPDAPWWSLKGLYIGCSGKKKADGRFRNFRAGARYDDVDGYTNWAGPLPSSRRYTGDAIEDTST